jgi:hypothetical protein
MANVAKSFTVISAWYLQTTVSDSSVGSIG